MEQLKKQALYGSVLIKAEEIMEFILNSNSAPSLNELSNGLNITKPTIYKILNTLQYFGYVIRMGDSGTYCLGTKFLKYAQKVSENFDINAIAKPYLSKLRDETNETVNLGIVQEDKIVLLAKLESAHSVNLVSRVGGYMEMYSSAMGRALLAHYPIEKIKHYIKETDFKPLTPNTVTDKNKFLELLKTTKDNGYAIDNVENQPDIFCVGFPIIKAQRIFGAFSISAPKYRINKKVLNSIIKFGKQTQLDIVSVI
ncbi:MAG: IclR family transcriptional regulator [Sporolactobacillus sp.]